MISPKNIKWAFCQNCNWQAKGPFSNEKQCRECGKNTSSANLSQFEIDGLMKFDIPIKEWIEAQSDLDFRFA